MFPVPVIYISLTIKIEQKFKNRNSGVRYLLYPSNTESKFKII